MILLLIEGPIRLIIKITRTHSPKRAINSVFLTLSTAVMPVTFNIKFSGRVNKEGKNSNDVRTVVMVS